MAIIFHTYIFKRLAPVFIFFALSLAGFFLFFIWRYEAFPAEKRIAKNIELASYGAGRIRSNVDFCLPRLGLPVCSAELLENDAPGTACFIQKCSWGHVINLNLYGGRLAALPAGIANLPGLVELDLHGNRLKGLPPEIGQLNSLTELDLSGNHLTSLPPEIGRLSNLKKLNVSGNQLTSLPPEIGQLRNLTYLNVGDNPLRGPLPEFLTRLPLEALVYAKTDLCIPVEPDFQGWINRVATINFAPSPQPRDVCSLAAEDQQAVQALYEIPGRPAGWDLNKLPCTWARVNCDAAGHIIHLDLSSMPVKIFPPEIGLLSHLQYLNLTEAQLTDIPTEIGKLHSLTHLYLGGNRLSRLPVEIGQLRNLTELVLDHNRLERLPPEIGQLQNLSFLNLYGNQLASLPPEIGQLTHLTLLDVSGNPLSGPLPVFLTHLPNVAFVFSNTGLCVPKNDVLLDWLGRQARGIYTYTESGERVYTPPNPGASIRSYLEDFPCP